MSDCPVCLAASETETTLCACGYSYNAQEIACAERIRSHAAQVANRSWQEEILLKKRITDIQLKKHGTYSRHRSPSGEKIGWSERRTAEMLGKAPASTSLDIRLAEALERYPDLAACGHKTEAKRRLARLQKNPALQSTAEAFKREADLQHYFEQYWSETRLSVDWELEPTRNLGMDILAKHRREPQWLVIELKVEQSSDQAVGQVLRYMGLVKRRLAKGDEVRGLIIAYTPEEGMLAALSMVLNVDLMLYRVLDGHLNLYQASTEVDRAIIKLMDLPQDEQQQIMQQLMKRGISAYPPKGG